MGSQQLFEPLRGFRTFKTTNISIIKMVFRSDPVESPEEVRQRENIIKVNLAHNKISKITPQFGGACFLNLTSLNVSTNRLSTLPAELSQCKQLQSVDISANNFVEIPSVILQLESVTDINAKTNYIAEVDEIESSESLEVLNIEENPLSTSCRDKLQRIDRA